ncbi:MAG: hypothetical protein FH753_13110 [Firmicutes bacterium]|nr:hypothetical protein [Bacillota bacterium]
MLYKLQKDNTIEPLAFVDFSDQNKLEKDLENLLAENLFSKLFENTPLLTIFQERFRQGEADIYALNKFGDLIVFELKRSKAGRGSIDQLFRYVTEAGEWTYTEIENKLRIYNKDNEEYNDMSLSEVHQDVFSLDKQLKEDEFNNQQHMWIVGSAADNSLIRAVNFWKQKGLSIDFFPYRIYEIDNEFYFEFFAKPYDVHVNPSTRKGVIFDTNKTYDPDSFESMITQNRISAYGDRKKAVTSLEKGDLVFYSHKGYGIVGAAKIIGRKIKKENNNEWYWDVELLTPKPQDFKNPKAMSFKEVQKVTDKSFYWARTQKVPYLTYEESEHLLEELRQVLIS